MTELEIRVLAIAKRCYEDGHTDGGMCCRCVEALVRDVRREIINEVEKILGHATLVVKAQNPAECFFCDNIARLGVEP